MSCRWPEPGTRCERRGPGWGRGLGRRGHGRPLVTMAAHQVWLHSLKSGEGPRLVPRFIPLIPLFSCCLD